MTKDVELPNGLKKSDFVFGVTKVRGVFAGPTNPIREGIFVEHIRRTGKMNPGSTVRLTDGKGLFWEFPIGNVIILHSGESAESADKRADELYEKVRPR